MADHKGDTAVTTKTPVENNNQQDKPAEDKVALKLSEIAYPASAPKDKVEGTRSVAPETSRNGEFTKEPYSPDVSAVAFGALKDKLGVDLLAPGKWDPKTTEQRWWSKAMPEAYANRDQLPPGLEIKAMAAMGKGGAQKVNEVVGTQLQDSGKDDSLYLAGSIAKSDTWSAKAKTMEIKDEKGQVVTNPNRTDGKADSIYKQGVVYNVDGVKVFEIHKDNSGAKTFAIADPGNLPAGMDYNTYAQKMITKALQTEGKAGPIEFPAYEKKVQQDLSGIIGMGVKNSNLYIAQAKMDAIWAANKDGKFAIEKQSFELRTRSFSRPPEDPPAERLDRSRFMVAETTQLGHVYMAARFDAKNGELKVPDIEKLKREAGYTGK
ncbi:MAG: hypothetical protein QG625_2250 [Cyanobacteriota bacterium erpe_2018_sw_39hr_WHONDRS-SW48-000098_B_bin.30]|nr:hypothetical protein [Cyanobacteriota bacterium erpe_2018_sw_39hr_WHONDRS-SW48-000098_B_bin.30]